jgi:hypothetical protein
MKAKGKASYLDFADSMLVNSVNVGRYNNHSRKLSQSRQAEKSATSPR